ncbi:hypothetical protein BH09BAC1_BH09BAC1_11200 [soil metagenome]
MKPKQLLTTIAVVGSFIAAGAAVVQSAKQKELDLQTVKYVDIARYMGEWYEIASFPNRFQKGCHCTKAIYRFNKERGFVEVRNSCRKGSPPVRWMKPRARPLLPIPPQMLN